MSIVVIRCILGFTPSEWAYAATQRTRTEISQGFTRSLDRKIRLNPLDSIKDKGITTTGVSSPIGAACELLEERFLGRPFAGHRDSVSELVGDALEPAMYCSLKE